MKKLQLMLIIMSVVMGSFSSCSKDSTTTPGTTTATSTILLQGTWKITYFNDSGTDGTANYNGYIITFVSGGSVSVINGSIVYNGSWSTHNDDSQNKLYMNFGTTTSPMVELQKDWHLIEKTNVKIRMEDISGGAGGTDYLTIERI